MARRGQIGIIVFILVVVLAIAIILLIIFLNGKDEPRPVVENATVNKTYYNITVRVNASFLVSYQLENGSGAVLLKGQLFPNAIEEYNVGVEANTTVKLSAWSREYYWNQTVCNITENDYSCGVRLKQKALAYKISLSNSSLIIDPRNLTLQAPILICWSERANVANVVMSLPLQLKVPKDLKVTYDFCYVVVDDITKRKSWEVEIHKNPFLNTTNLLKLLIRDYEVDGHENIADRITEVWV